MVFTGDLTESKARDYTRDLALTPNNISQKIRKFLNFAAKLCDERLIRLFQALAIK